MRFLTTGWSYDPFLIYTAVIAVWHEIGIRHLAGRSRPIRNAARRRQSLLFYAGLVVLDLTVVSPIDYYSDLYFWVHMVQHLLLEFAAPVLIVVGAPWMPLVHGLPVQARRRLGRAVLLAGWSAPIRTIGRTLSRPWVAVVVFNVTMIIWHVPAAFDLAYRDQDVHIYLMHASLFATGVFFWVQFIGSYPLRPKLSPVAQFSALFATNVVMFVIAVDLGMLATTSTYSVYDHLPGVTLSALGDQHIAAGILWVCGDFWCIPAMYRAIRRLIDEDKAPTLDGVIDRLLRGTS